MYVPTRERSQLARIKLRIRVFSRPKKKEEEGRENRPSERDEGRGSSLSTTRHGMRGSGDGGRAGARELNRARPLVAGLPARTGSEPRTVKARGRTGVNR